MVKHSQCENDVQKVFEILYSKKIKYYTQVVRK